MKYVSILGFERHGNMLILSSLVGSGSMITQPGWYVPQMHALRRNVDSMRPVKTANVTVTLAMKAILTSGITIFT